ncbi:MAG TPA: hypothetical protein ENL03_03410 [Phycisphaerae bacterium]|nr:hypothetical protein [Phycisphaerae bacterium]
MGSSGAGIVLALSLASPLQPLAISLSGVAVYFLVILIDPLKGLLLWMATQILLDRYLNISLGAGIPDLSLTRLCLALITVLLLARTAIRHYRLQPVNKFDVVAFLFMVGIMQSGPRGARGLGSIQNAFDQYWIPILTYFTVKNLVTSRRSVHLVLYAVLCVALYTAVYAFYETTTGNVLLDHRVGGYYFYSDSGLRALRGIWDGNTGFARPLVMAIPILFYFYLKAPSPFRRIFFSICLALVFGGLYLTYKRGAWIAMVASLFVMQLFWPQFRRLFIVLLIVVSIACALNWDDISTSTVYTERVNSQLSTSEARTKAWEHALEFWSARPLLGHGLSQYPNLARAAGYREDAVESEFLEILVSAGLVGFLPYIGLLLLMGYDGFQIYRGRVAGSLVDRDLVVAFWGILIGFSIATSTAIVTCLINTSMFFAVAGAIIYARRPLPVRSPESQVVPQHGKPLNSTRHTLA